MRRRGIATIACTCLCALPASARAATHSPPPAGTRTSPSAAAPHSRAALPPASTRASGASQASSGQSTTAGTPIPVPASNVPPAGRRLSANRVLAIAGPDREEILYGDIDPALARQKKLVRVPGEHEIDRIADRRPSFYTPLVAPNGRD